MNDREQLLGLLKTRSFRTGDFVLASGRRSSFYIDARLTTMSAEGQRLVGSLGLAAIRAHGWDVAAVGGLTMGADPIAFAIANASAMHPPCIDAFSVRKEAKDHGAGRRIEGNLRPNDGVVIVEDVITTGGSAIKAIEAVEAEGGRVVGVLALVDRQEGGKSAIQKKIGDDGLVVALTTINEIAAVGT